MTNVLMQSQKAIHDQKLNGIIDKKKYPIIIHT